MHGVWAGSDGPPCANATVSMGSSAPRLTPSAAPAMNRKTSDERAAPRIGADEIEEHAHASVGWAASGGRVRGALEQLERVVAQVVAAHLVPQQLLVRPRPVRGTRAAGRRRSAPAPDRDAAGRRRSRADRRTGAGAPGASQVAGLATSTRLRAGVKSIGRPVFQGCVRRRVLCSSRVCGVEVVEVVPLGLEAARSSRAARSAGRSSRCSRARRSKSAAKSCLAAPVRELRAVEQHHAAGHVLAAAGLAARPAPDRLALHVAREQLPDVAHREDVGIDHQRAAAVAHQLGRRREAQRREGLQVVVAPHHARPSRRKLWPSRARRNGKSSVWRMRTSKRSACAEFRRRECCETRAPRCWRSLVWMKTQGRSAPFKGRPPGKCGRGGRRLTPGERAGKSAARRRRPRLLWCGASSPRTPDAPQPARKSAAFRPAGARFLAAARAAPPRRALAARLRAETRSSRARTS